MARMKFSVLAGLFVTALTVICVSTIVHFSYVSNSTDQRSSSELHNVELEQLKQQQQQAIKQIVTPPIYREEELLRWGERYPVRLLCWIPLIIKSDAAEQKMRRIQATYGPLCDVGPLYTIFESEDNNRTRALEAEGFQILRLEDSENFGTLWSKSRRGWEILGQEPWISQADWFVRLDDDTFFSPLNFKGFAQFYSPQVKHYLGLPMYHIWFWPHTVFNSGGCIVLSQRALKHFVEFAPSVYDKYAFCRRAKVNGHGEDAELSYCLSKIGVLAENTLDADGLHRFGAHFNESVEYVWNVSFPQYSNRPLRDHQKAIFWKDRPSLDKKGCCSKDLISYHRPYKGITDAENKEWLMLHELLNDVEAKPLDQFSIPPKPRIFPWEAKQTTTRILTDRDVTPE